MALVASANGGESPIQQLSSQRRQSSSAMEPPRVERASQLASEYSSLLGASSSVDSPELFNGSPNRQREMDLVAAAAMKSEEYRQLFRLPPGEVLVQDFNCALQENILCQGHLYVFRSYMCFYSNIFGFETKKIIPFSAITLLRRAKTAGIFPNAIEVFTEEKKHFFASFLSRDEAYNLLSDLCPDCENSVKKGSQIEYSPSESSSRICESLATSNADRSGEGTDDLEFVARIPNVPVTNDSGSISVADDRNGPVTPSQKSVEVVAAVVTDTVPLLSAKNMVLKLEDTDAPSVPEDFVKVAEAKFPIKVAEFFRFFFSDEAVSFVESFHKQCGDTDFKCTEWCPSDKYGRVREVSFLHPIKIYLGAKSGSCRETQKCQIYKNNHLIVETSQEVNGVPYADYFTVEGIWDVESIESGEACVLKVFLNVAFSKRTVWKGKIVQSTQEECREAYAIWIKIAHELLKKKNLEKQDEASTYSSTEDVLDSSVQKAEIGESSSMLQQAEKRVGSTENGNSFLSPTLFRGKFAKMFGAVRNQAYLPHLLVITVAVVLMMQLTIVLLLSRPPQVQPGYQMDYFNDMNQGLRPSPQGLAWVENRIHYLKEEMLMVESRLERMRLEHKHLKSQLEDFEHFSRKDQPLRKPQSAEINKYKQ